MIQDLHDIVQECLVFKWPDQCQHSWGKQTSNEKRYSSWSNPSQWPMAYQPTQSSFGYKEWKEMFKTKSYKGSIELYDWKSMHNLTIFHIFIS